MKKDNGAFFLSMIQKKIREERECLPKNELFFNRIEKTVRGLSANIWFMTEGCQWDKSGGCTMCNYGKGHCISDDQMMKAVLNGVNNLPEGIKELFISPSGSMLDVKEVSHDVRTYIFNLVSKLDVAFFAFETRLETICKDDIKELRNIIQNKKIGIEIGLESSNQWIRKYCINKGDGFDKFKEIANLLRDNDIEFIANISLGVPFLSQKDAIEDTLTSATWAIENGADTVVIFPLHIKPGTLLAWLYQNGYYEPPSLWSLIEVLSQLPPNVRKKTDISWYRNCYQDEKKVLKSPTTCPICESKILELLDEYRISRSDFIINQLVEVDCDCKAKWKHNLKQKKIVVSDIKNIYSKMAHSFGFQNWWEENYAEVLLDMEQDYV